MSERGSTPRERVTVDAELLLDALHVVSCPFYECARCSEITARYENTGGEIGVLKALDDAVKVSRTSAMSETSTREQILDEAVRRIEQSRDARFHEEGGSLTQDTNEPTGASHISDWIEGMDDAVEVVRTFKERT
jgi:hypothetical protein